MTLRHLTSSAIALASVLAACIPDLEDHAGDARDDRSAAAQAGVVGDCGSQQPITSVSASVAQDGNGPAHAIDGDLATRWSGKGIGAALVADLGASKQVCSVQVAWYQGDARRNQFEIRLSSDGVHFTPAFAGTSAQAAGLQGYRIPPTQARYVELVVNGNTQNDWASVLELEVSAFVLHETKPTAASTGAGVIRPLPTRVIERDVVMTTDGQQLLDTIVRGHVIIKARNALVSNCVVDGGPAQTATGWVIDTTAAQDARIEFTTVRAAHPTPFTHGIGPRGYTAYRVDVSGVVDAFSAFPATAGEAVHVSIQGSYGHDLSHFAPDPNHPGDDSRTHNDVLQSQGGAGLEVIGSHFAAYHDPTIGTQPVPQPSREIAAIMVSNNVGTSTGMVVEDNWLGGGVYTVNAGGAPGSSGRFLRNRFDRGSQPGTGPDDTHTLVFDAGFVQTSIGNVYEDNGHPVRVRTNS